MQKIIRSLVASAGLAVGVAFAQAPIVVHHIGPFTGVLAASNKESIAGAQLYLDAFNGRGGVQGRRVQLRTLDDGQDPKRTKEHFDALIASSQLLALHRGIEAGLIDRDAALAADIGGEVEREAEGVVQKKRSLTGQQNRTEFFKEPGLKPTLLFSPVLHQVTYVCTLTASHAYVHDDRLLVGYLLHARHAFRDQVARP